MKRSMVCFAMLSVVGFIFLTIFPSYGLTAQKFPSKKIIWLVPSKPGGGFDLYARVVGKTMLKYLPEKTKVVIKNLPAGGGIEAVTKLYKAKPDGHTVGIVKVPGSIVSQHSIPGVRYDVAKLSYIGTITTDDYSIYVEKGSPINSLKDMQKKGTIKFATSGVGATSWVYAVIIAKEMGIKASYVHYTSTADSTLSVLRGSTEVALHSMFGSLPYVRSGDIRVLAICSDKRIPEAPDVPTVAEAGFPQFCDYKSSRVLAAPPNVPPNILKILEDAFWKAVHDKELQQKLQKAKRPIVAPSKGEKAKKTVLGANKLYLKYSKALTESLKE